MHIYQYLGAITLAPENEEEARAIERLMGGVKVGDPWAGSVAGIGKGLNGGMVCNWAVKGAGTAHPDNEQPSPERVLHEFVDNIVGAQW